MACLCVQHIGSCSNLSMLVYSCFLLVCLHQHLLWVIMHWIKYVFEVHFLDWLLYWLLYNINSLLFIWQNRVFWMATQKLIDHQNAFLQYTRWENTFMRFRSLALNWSFDLICLDAFYYSQLALCRRMYCIVELLPHNMKLERSNWTQQIK